MFITSNAGGLRAILTDQNKLVVAVGGVTALAAGIYTTRYCNGGDSATPFSLLIINTFIPKYG